MKYWKRNVLAAAMASSLALLTACGGSHDDDDEEESTPPVAEARGLDLTILHINDQHSNLDGKSKELTLKNAAGATVKTTVTSAGFPRVKAAMDALAAQSTNVLKLHAGDAVTGTLYFNRAGEPGEADAALMNTVCFDAMTLGNHEFDKGDAGLKQFIGYLHKDACKTPILSANVTFGASSPLFAATAPDKVLPYTIVQRDDQPIGIIGLTIASKTKQSSSPDPDTNFSDEATAAQTQIDALRAQGVNKIVLLSHIGYDYDKDVIAKLSGVDVVVGGDSHTLLGPDGMSTTNVGTPQGSYPTQTRDKDGKLVCLVQAWEYTQVVGELKVSFDKNGDVTQCVGTPHVLIDSDFQVDKAPASAADQAAFVADVAASGFLRIQTPDAGATATLQPFKAKVDAYSKSEVATVPLELCRRRVPGTKGISDLSNSSAACNAEGSVAVRGGDIQQLVAQAYLDVANEEYGGADITLQSGGGVRIALTGTVTAAKVIEVLPFGNMLWRLDITATEVKSMLEDGMQAVFGPSGTSGPYPYAGGLRWDTDSTQAQGNRVSNIEFYDRATSTWLPLDTARTYKLFVLSFNATGGDGYKTLANVPAERRQDIGVLDADVFQTYIDQQAKDSATGLPILNRLPHSVYSTKSFIE
ncbi:bifunctional UDP-sugar hydrolase/5'-nucleotidase [Bordetella sp. N]|uniref:bifunctional metallophosphatase/5'-nucleotidase n=1 Tax=Bordetella sp. N TaxID=1746199 RepID=UPI00070CBA85|nr:5'-nucleotidase C-terminal domain-containing protein [Bordetella sp. N]ALM85053.1 bifunctional metallophosphatase/5'-nucleotidase [Bordetella sp. N]